MLFWDADTAMTAKELLFVSAGSSCGSWRHAFRHMACRIVLQQRKQKSLGRMTARRPQVLYQVRNEIWTVLCATFKDAARHGSHLPDLGLPAVRSAQPD